MKVGEADREELERLPDSYFSKGENAKRTRKCLPKVERTPVRRRKGGIDRSDYFQKGKVGGRV